MAHKIFHKQLFYIEKLRISFILICQSIHDLRLIFFYLFICHHLFRKIVLVKLNNTKAISRPTSVQKTLNFDFLDISNFSFLALTCSGGPKRDSRSQLKRPQLGRDYTVHKVFVLGCNKFLSFFCCLPFIRILRSSSIHKNVEFVLHLKN